MWGRGLRGNSAACSTLCWFSVTPPATHKQTGPFWCCFPGGWVWVHSRTLWVSPMNSPMRLGVSPAVSTPTGVFNQRFEALFPHAGALSCAVWLPRPIVPPGLSALECGTARYAMCCLTGSSSHLLAVSPLCPAARLHPSYWSG